MDDSRPASPASPLAEDPVVAARRAKIAPLRDGGVAYPNDVFRTHHAEQLKQKFGDVPAERLGELGTVAIVAGRLMEKRRDGADGTCILADNSGTVQVLVSEDISGRTGVALFEGCDVGDIVSARGTLQKLPSGEIIVRGHELQLLAKSLRPLPQAPSASPQERYSSRYVDLVVNPGSRRIFEIRYRLIQAIRAFFRGTGYMEVETPLLHAAPAAGEDRQCRTQHNALDRQLYLRASPGLNLRKLVVGGMDKVYEINRSFVGGAAAVSGNPEATSMEVCVSFSNHLYMAALVERVLGYAVGVAFGGATPDDEGLAPGFGKPFARVGMTDALRRHGNAAWSDAELRDAAFLCARLAEAGAPAAADEPWGLLQSRLFDAVAARHLVEPTFVTDIPADGGPPVLCTAQDPAIAERHLFFVGGALVGHGASELNDPEEFVRRWRGPVPPDPDYIRALEYGMPPSSGASLDIDLLLAKLTGQASVRDVILFPHAGPAAAGG